MEITVNMGALDGVTRDWIQNEARRTGASVEEVVMRLIKRGIAAERQAAEAQRYHELDILASTWGIEEADAFRVAAADFARIDETVWQ